jgi:uncharacterized protein
VDPTTPEASPLNLQISCLQSMLERNASFRAVLQVAQELCLPGWYLGAGGVAQTVWNLLHGLESDTGIKDYDLVYFDGSDLIAESEDRIESDVERHLSAMGPAVSAVTVDVKNEARVHLWYPERFGRDIEPYRSTEEAISTWPTTATSVGVRTCSEGFEVCAPYGLSDLLGMVVRPNKTIVSREIYERKVARWVIQWPKLRVIDW